MIIRCEALRCAGVCVEGGRGERCQGDGTLYASRHICCENKAEKLISWTNKEAITQIRVYYLNVCVCVPAV